MVNNNSNEDKPLYLDYTKSFEERVEDLISRMTGDVKEIESSIVQLGSTVFAPAL